MSTRNIDRGSNLTFNGVKLPTFVRVTNITYSMLPNMDATRDRTLFSERTITVDFIIIMNKMLILSELNEFNNWLKGDNFNPSKLRLPGNDFDYMAKVTNSVDISGDMRTGGGQIVFTCYEGNRLSETKREQVLANTGKTEVTYNGNTGAYPTITITPTSQISNVKIAIKNSRYNNFIEINGTINANKSLVIDMRTKKITVDGELRMAYMTLDSSFHKLEPSKNEYTITGANGIVKVEWYNEYL